MRSKIIPAGEPLVFTGGRVVQNESYFGVGIGIRKSAVLQVAV